MWYLANYVQLFISEFYYQPKIQSELRTDSLTKDNCER